MKSNIAAAFMANVSKGSQTIRYSLVNDITGISINNETGLVTLDSSVAADTFNIVVKVENGLNSLEDSITIILSGIAPDNYKYAVDSLQVIVGTYKQSSEPMLNKTGLVQKYRIYTAEVPGIKVDSLTGVVKIESTPKIGRYLLGIEVSNKFGLDKVDFIVNIFPGYDSIIGYSNATYRQNIDNSTNFDGYVQLENLDLRSGKYTIGTWAKLNSYPGVNWRRIVDFSIGRNLTQIIIAYDNDELFVSTNGAYNNRTPVSSIESLIPGFSPLNWNFYSLVVDISSIKIYMNGVLINTFSGAVAPGSIYPSANCFIGRSNYDNNPNTDGSFKEFSLWRRALNSGEITNLMQSHLSGYEQGLYYYLPLMNFQITDVQNIPNATIINNNCLLPDATRTALVKVNSGFDSVAVYKRDSIWNVYGTIREPLDFYQIIRVSKDNEQSWERVNLFNYNWSYNTLQQFVDSTFIFKIYDTLLQQNIRTIGVLNFFQFRGFKYSIDSLNIDYGINGSSVQPTILSYDSFIRYGIKGNKPTEVTIDSLTGIITVNNSLAVGVYKLNIYATNQQKDSLFLNYKITVKPIAPKILTSRKFYFWYENGRPLQTEALQLISTGVTQKISFQGDTTIFALDAYTGIITTKSAGVVGSTYSVKVLVENVVGLDSILYEIKKIAVLDTIIGLTASSVQLTSPTIAQSYIQLPSLDVRNQNYTIETWLYQDDTNAFYRRIFDFGNGESYSGILATFPNNNLSVLLYHSNSEDSQTSINNLVRPGWNHYAFSLNNQLFTVFLNGVNVGSYNSANQISEVLNSNYIGRSNWLNDAPMQGRFRDFKIWYGTRTAQQIINDTAGIPYILDSNLLYYLPLSKSTLFNETVNDNTSIGNGALGGINGNSRIVSIGNNTTRYNVTNFKRQLYGTYSGGLATGEVLQYTTDSQNWYSVTITGDNAWVATLNNFRGGLISLRGLVNNNDVSTRMFAPLYLVGASDTASKVSYSIDELNQISVSIISPLFRGGMVGADDTISYELRYQITGSPTITTVTFKDNMYKFLGKPGAQYNFWLSVRNRVATSVSSSVQQVNTQSLPNITINYDALLGEASLFSYENVGKDALVLITPNLGYHVDSIIINGVYLPNIDSAVLNGVLRLKEVFTNQTVYIKFAINKYSLKRIEYRDAVLFSRDSIIDDYGTTIRVTTLTNSAEGYILDSLNIDGNVFPPDSSVGYTFDNITNNHTIIVYQSLKKLKIRFSNWVKNQLIADSVIVRYGNNYNYIYPTYLGYRIDSVWVGNRKISLIGSSYTFNNVREDSAITVFYTAIRYRISLQNPEGGAVLPNMDSSLTINDTVQYYFSNNPTLIVDSVIVNEVNYQNNLTKYVFQGISSDQVLRVRYIVRPLSKVLILSQSQTTTGTNGGLITPLGNRFIDSGQDQRYLFSANAGYKLDSIVLGSKQTIKDSLTGYTFRNLQKDTSITTYYSLDSFDINRVVVGNGAILVSKAKLTILDSAECKITPQVGYYVESVFFNGTKQSLDSLGGTIILKNVSSTQTIKAVFKQYRYVVSYSRIYRKFNRLLSDSVVQEVDTVLSLSNKSYTIIAQEGYEIDSIISNGVNQAITNRRNQVIALSNISSNKNIKVVLKQRSLVVSYVAIGPGKITDQRGVVSENLVIESDTIAYGESITFKIERNNEGSYIDSILVLNRLINGDIDIKQDTTYSFPNLIGNLTLEVIFKYYQYTITTQTNGNISISPSQFRGLYNSDYLFNVVSNTGYYIDSIYILGGKNLYSFIDNGRELPITEGSYTVKDTAEQVIRVVSGRIADLEYYVITSITNGQISATQLYKYGSSVQVTYKLNEGYEIDSILLNGLQVSKDSVQSLTIFNLNGYKEIRVVTRLKRFTITASVGNNGSINPTGVSTVNYGDRPTYTITANTGYILDSLLVNGNKVTNTNTYQFDSIKTNQTIRAIFKTFVNITNAIQVTNTSCIGVLDGRITINFSQNSAQKIQIVGGRINIDTTINSNSYTLNNLDSGKYAITLTNISSGKPSNYEVRVSSPAPITGYSTYDAERQELSLNLNGATEYKIKVNGKIILTTTNSQVKISLGNGLNKITVESDQTCLGVYEEEVVVNTEIVAYPNPTAGEITIEMGKYIPQPVIEVQVNDIYGVEVLRRTVIVENGQKITLDLKNLKSGVYLIKLNNKLVRVIKN
ncbi:MAG: hypothetical protein ORN85_09075 [Sediminibacterium sp.]|nr:hypothetical protein [Sediminibacterium sp.]